MKKIIFLALLGLLSSALAYADDRIHEHGYWIGKEVVDAHDFDPTLANAIANFFEEKGATSVVDFGCGMGDYVRKILERRIKCEGYDGNPSTPQITKGLCCVLDLSKPQNLDKTFDWVLSLEVGEHLPPQYEKHFIENLIRHCKDGIVLSWALKGQSGYGHFNTQDNDYIKSIFASCGFENDLMAENNLRNNSSLPYFKNTVMVFKRISKK